MPLSLRQILKYPTIALCTFILSACQVGVGPASVNPTPAPTQQPTDQPSPLPGGFTDQSPTDPEMLAIFAEAQTLLQAKYPTAGIQLTQLKSIASQVVAGSNFRIEADYTDNTGSGTVELTVFRSLQGEFSLSADNYTP
ncbi:MAG: hypothetical protein CVV27_05975 [Candidatus Melainabacteria bacterium HGW-Melainabacteria-1]|nr:MAG: hypothetical protein CVV27_05975 [Candidatus Melainabacteria bacterium HGW-Melainabacteria-1]